MFTSRLRLTYSNVMSTIAVFLALGGGAFAAISSIPDANGVFHGCVSKETGVLRVVKSGGACNHTKKRGELVVSWNQLGQPGKPGTNGQPGMNGQPGINGATNVVARTSSSSVDPGVSDGLPPPMCNPGERATGGGAGFVIGGTVVLSGGDTLLSSVPLNADGFAAAAGDVPRGWETTIRNGSASTRTAVFYVICASP